MGEIFHRYLTCSKFPSPIVQLKTARLELAPDAQCATLLVQGYRTTGAPPPSIDWTPVWQGARPGDHKEFYRLYRRDVAPGHTIAQFPE